MAMPISTRIGENSFNAADQSTSGTVDIGFPDAPASVRLQLRRSTAELHAGLDGCIAPLLSKGVREYVTFLRRTAAALLPIEDALEAADVAALVPDWNERSRRQALALDLAELDADVARAMPFAPIRSHAFAFGVLYVLEGSRLGATSLARIVAGHSDARLQAATRYLNHGVGHKLWPRFLTQLETSKPVRRAPQETTAGAIAAFGAFVAAFKAARA
jgi:heme oxygenase